MSNRIHYRVGEIEEFRGNQLIEALPPIASSIEVLDHFSTYFTPTREERANPPHIRRKYVQRVKQFVFPLPEYLDLYLGIEDTIMDGYLSRNPTTEIRNA